MESSQPVRRRFSARSFLLIAGIIAACFAGGFSIGLLLGAIFD